MRNALVGFGGQAKHIMAQMGEQLPCFVEPAHARDGALPLSAFEPSVYRLLVAIGDCGVRSRILEQLPASTEFFSFVHPAALLMGKVRLGTGCFVGAFTAVMADVAIGDHAMLNGLNHIGHETVIGRCFSAMPGAKVSGRCVIGDNVYVGANAAVRERLTVCSGTKIGLGAAVVRDIVSPGLYIGVPARRRSGPA